MKSFAMHKQKLLWLVLTATLVGGVGAYFVFSSQAATSSNNIYRLVNTNGKHIITTDTAEKNSLVSNGWTLQLTKTYAVVSGSGTTAYSRLYSPDKKVWNLTNPTRTNELVSQGWVNQGVKFNSVKGYSAAAPYGYCRTSWFKLVKNFDRFYTPDVNEKNTYINQRGYTLEEANYFELFMACSTNPAPNPLPDPDPPLPPNPLPNPNPNPNTGGGTTTPQKKTQITPAPTAQLVSTGADATITAGTRSAQFAVSSAGAQTVKVLYGNAADKLDKSTDEQPVSGSNTTTFVKDLEPLSTYHYQVVRKVNGQAKPSATASFKTTGYDLVLNFTDNEGSPIADITGKILSPEQEATSNESGTMRFTNVPAGAYTIDYTYDDKQYSEALDTSSPANEDDLNLAAVLYASTSIDVSTLGQNDSDESQAAEKKSSKLPLMLGILLLLGIIGGVVLFIRRRSAGTDTGSVYIAPPVPVEKADPSLHHVGESLRDMVVKSMREQAQHDHEQKPPKDPPAQQ